MHHAQLDSLPGSQLRHSPHCIPTQTSCLCHTDTTQVLAGGYRYGFNGMEREQEWGGDSYDFGARIYDARIGRWLSVDPAKSEYPAWTPYNFAINSPLALDDPDGRNPRYIWGKTASINFSRAYLTYIDFEKAEEMSFIAHWDNRRTRYEARDLWLKNRSLLALGYSSTASLAIEGIAGLLSFISEPTVNRSAIEATGSAGFHFGPSRQGAPSDGHTMGWEQAAAANTYRYIEDAIVKNKDKFTEVSVVNGLIQKRTEYEWNRGEYSYQPTTETTYYSRTEQDNYSIPFTNSNLVIETTTYFSQEKNLITGEVKTEKEHTNTRSYSENQDQ